MGSVKTLLIRADASVAIGTGHIMRMIALGQEWQARGGGVLFACAEITPALRERLAQEGFALQEIAAQPGSAGDLAATCDLIRQSQEKNPVVALDGYQFDADFQLGLKNAGCRLLVMDDYGHSDFYHADWVLNQNISAREELYRNRAPDTELLLGPKFALLRKEFLKYRGWKREIPEVARKVFVTLGGADPENVTQRVIEAMAELKMDLEVKVVVGGSNPRLPKLREAVENLKSSPARFELVFNPSNMPELMIWADLAVAAGGSTSLELAFFGLPAIYCVLAENQREIAVTIEKKELGFYLATAFEHLNKTFETQALKLIQDSQFRGEISANGASAVDGKGSIRIAEELLGVQKIHFRKFCESDFKMLWEWANDENTRKYSFDSEKIQWEEHEQWCRQKLNDESSLILIASDSCDLPIGCMRFDELSANPVASVNLAPASRGRGIGKKLIREGTENFLSEHRCEKIHAFIKPENLASIKSFESAGFVFSSNLKVKGCPALLYTFSAY